MDSENKIRLVLETQGTDEMNDAAKSIEDLAEKIDILNDEFVDLSSGAIEKTIKVIEELDDSIATGLIKSTGEYWVTLKDGQRLLANTADGFRKLIDDEGRYLVTLSDGRRVWNDSKAAIDATNEALLKYQKELRKAAIETGETLESIEGFMTEMRQSLKKGLEEPTENIGYSINKLGKVTMPEMGEATRGAKKGFEQYSESIHQVAMGLEDLQYGFRGIQNNLPGIARAFGLGAGLAGVVSLASTAFATLGPKVLELIEGLETKKVKEKIGDLVGTFSELSTKVEGLKKSLDELKKSEDTSIVNILKAKSATEELLQAETELETARENAATAKAAREKQTDANAQGLSERKDAYRESAVDFGQGKDAQQETLSAIYDANMKDFDPKKQSLLEYGKKYGVKPGNEVNHFIQQRAMANPDAPMMTQDEALESIMSENGFDQKGIAAAQRKAQELSEKQRDEIFGQLEKAKTLEEFDIALRKLAEVNPRLAAQISDRLEYDQGINKNELAEKRATEQKARLDRERAVNQKKLSADPRMGKAGEEDALLSGRAVKMQKSKGDFDQQELEPWDKAGLTKEEWTAQQKSLADVAKNRNEAIAKLDPFQAAAQRQLQAGTGPDANRRMAALRQRDTQLFQQKLMAGGMGRGEAEESAKQSLTGGDKQLNDFARMSGANTKSVIGMNRAAQMAMQRLEATQNEQQRQMEIQTQNFNQIQRQNNAGRPRWQGGARSR